MADCCPTCGLDESRREDLEAENAALSAALERACQLLRRTEHVLTEGIELLDDVREVEHLLELPDEPEAPRG